MGTKVHYVIFDGTSHYVGDDSDLNSETEIVFRSMNLDICQDKADELNDLI